MLPAPSADRAEPRRRRTAPPGRHGGSSRLARSARTSMRTTSNGNSPSEREPIRLTPAQTPGPWTSLACNLCASLPPVPFLGGERPCMLLIAAKFVTLSQTCTRRAMDGNPRPALCAPNLKAPTLARRGLSDSQPLLALNRYVNQGVFRRGRTTPRRSAAVGRWRETRRRAGRQRTVVIR
jgi:hypothetical protein